MGAGEGGNDGYGDETEEGGREGGTGTSPNSNLVSARMSPRVSAYSLAAWYSARDTRETSS